jgi:hypothetical protein
MLTAIVLLAAITIAPIIQMGEQKVKPNLSRWARDQLANLKVGHCEPTAGGCGNPNWLRGMLYETRKTRFQK